ncbi:Uncharacterised protein [Mycobacteroides abscessus subsp. abscessus]|nr:Uncharacterised protein [Mycobacteroides abscessus subsp. abscessus]
MLRLILPYVQVSEGLPALSRVAINQAQGGAWRHQCGSQVSRTVHEHPGMSLVELCIVSDVIHSKVQVSTVCRLEEAGFQLEADITDGQPHTHHHVLFEEPVQESTLSAFIQCFDEPIPTPSGGKQRKPE